MGSILSLPIPIHAHLFFPTAILLRYGDSSHNQPHSFKQLHMAQFL